MQINEESLRKKHKALLIKDLIDHYILTELSDSAKWHSHSTKIVYKGYLERWVRPSWGGFNIREVRTIVVEEWLRHLNRADGKPLANSTKAKIRNLMSVLFNHAVRYEWLAQGKNPVTLVRQSAQRMNTPVVLLPRQIQSLLTILESPYRLMVLLAATTGLRRSELFALKWEDVDYASLTLQIRRSIYGRVVGNCKTATSKKDLPLSSYVAGELRYWQQQSSYKRASDWVFASPRSNGVYPYWPAVLLAKSIRPAAARAGIMKRIGWHTFRHTYSTMLVANGENVKVVQELMRHANSRCTLEIYSQAGRADKRVAQQRILQLIFPEDLNSNQLNTSPETNGGGSFEWIN